MTRRLRIKQEPGCPGLPGCPAQNSSRSLIHVSGAAGGDIVPELGFNANFWFIMVTMWFVLFFGGALLSPATGVCINSVHPDLRSFRYPTDRTCARRIPVLQTATNQLTAHHCPTLSTARRSQWSPTTSWATLPHRSPVVRTNERERETQHRRHASLTSLMFSVDTHSSGGWGLNPWLCRPCFRPH